MSSRKNKPRKSRAKKRAPRPKGPTLAEQADRHELYERSVQDVSFEFEFVDETYERLRGRKASLLREDFCGTAAMSCEWVRQRPGNRAIGVDLDPEVLAWGREHNVARLDEEQQQRLQLVQANVMEVQTEAPDLVIAMNFSYQIFMDRDTLRAYFAKVREDLAGDGVFIIDVFGGYEAYQELEEVTRHKGFTYVWDQHSYDPISGEMTCYIHFRFPDGSRMERAFEYHWRLWTLPELQEILKEAGFARITVYWQGEDEEGEPDGNFQPATRGDADPGWIAFISAEK